MDKMNDAMYDMHFLLCLFGLLDVEDWDSREKGDYINKVRSRGWHLRK